MMNTSHRLPSPSLLLAAAAGSISSAAQQPPTAAAEASGEDLLQCMVPPGQPLKLARATLPGVGGALVAAQVLEPGELLLSVPEPLWLTARGPHWAAEMAEQLLALRDSGKAEHWIAALPQRAPPLPWLDDWTEEEVAELQDEDVMAEVQHMRRELEDACAALGADQDYAQEDITWALAMVHSRQFLLADQHVIVPGIDLANHSPAPNASVRCVRSPGTCQGRVAEEEVCDPTSLPPPEPSLFQLVAGERGIAAGEEVTISYGSWPSDVLLTRWGFVPDKLDSPHEATVIFFGLEELAAFHLALADELHGEGDSYLQQQQQQQQQGQQPEEAAVGALVAALEADLDSSRQDYYRLAVTADGFDARLLRAAEALLRAESMPPSMLTGLLALRLERLLEAFPTGLDEDLELLQQLECGSSACNGSSSSAVERLLAAVRCRTSKKRVLLSALQAMQP